MPVTPRKFYSPQAQKIADQVMELAQRYGSDLGTAEPTDAKEAPKKRKLVRKDRQNIQQADDFTGV